jgi:hypothetical protein
LVLPAASAFAQVGPFETFASMILWHLRLAVGTAVSSTGPLVSSAL